MNNKFQSDVKSWLVDCFGDEIANDPNERNFRFLEEAIELVQSCGATKEQCHFFVDYVFGREIGEKEQELGGVIVTLAALCNVQGLDMEKAGLKELADVQLKIDAIRAKQLRKPKPDL